MNKCMSKFKVGDRVIAVKDDYWCWGDQDRGRIGTIIEKRHNLAFDYAVLWDNDVYPEDSFLYYEQNLKLKPKFFQEELEV